MTFNSGIFEYLSQTNITIYKAICKYFSFTERLLVIHKKDKMKQENIEKKERIIKTEIIINRHA